MSTSPKGISFFFIYTSDLFSGIQTNWTLCPLGRKSIEIKTNSTSLFNYYSKSQLFTT